MVAVQLFCVNARGLYGHSKHVTPSGCCSKGNILERLPNFFFRETYALLKKRSHSEMSEKKRSVAAEHLS